MKALQSGLMTTFLFSSVAYAINPIPGWYAGLIVGGSKAPAITFDVVTPVQGHSGTGTLSYSLLGNVGGQIGYRFHNLRVEGEFFYNNNPYSHLNIGETNIPNVNSNNQSVQQTTQFANPFTFQGYTNTYAMMFNGFYDFYIPEYTEHVVPYVGVGAGYAHVENNIEFFYNGSSFPGSDITRFTNNFAGQGIVGLSYFLTDFTSFSLDFRYFSAFNSHAVDAQFNSFQGRPQLYALNLLFNSAFNFA